MGKHYQKKCHKGPFSTKNSQWARWGHDNANTFANLKETKINKDNVANLSQVWNFQLPAGDGIEVDPIIVDGIMYVLSQLGYLWAVDTKTGTPLPGFNGGQPVFVGANPIFGTNFGSTPIVFRDFIYVATDDMILRSFNRFTGVYNPSWPPNGTVTIPVYPANNPVATAQGSVQGSLSIVDDGKHSLLFVPVASETELEFPSIQSGTINAYNLNGTLIWSQVIASPAEGNGFGIGTWSTPAFDTENKLMFLGTSNPQTPPAGKISDSLQARDYRTGKLVWNFQYVEFDVSGFSYPYGNGNPEYLVDKDVGASPNLFDVCHDGKKKYLIGAAGKDGVYRAFDRCTGKLEWQRVLTNTASIWGNPSAAYANGVIYAGATSDVNPDTAGNPPTGYPTQVSDNATSSFAFTTQPELLPRLFGGFLTMKGIVNALDARTGEVIWGQTFPTALWASLSYANGIVYTGSYDGSIRALDAETGTVLATYLTPVQPPSPPLPLAANYFVPANVVIVKGQLFVPYENFFGTVGGVVSFE